MFNLGFPFRQDFTAEPVANKKLECLDTVPRLRDEVPRSKKSVQNCIALFCVKIWIGVRFEENFRDRETDHPVIELLIN